MAVVALVVSKWSNKVVLIGVDQYSAYGYMVTCRYGIYSETSRIDQIAHARDKYLPFWGMSGHEVVTVGGQVVDDSYQLADGDELVFHRT